MIKLKLYNTLSRKKEEFRPIKKGRVGLYTCGPTVYNYAHIGNLRAYVFEDVLRRVLLYNGYKVKHVMNITDVGHLTGDRDLGEDKLEIGARREGKSAWQIAEFYTEAFKEDIARLNILPPDIWCKATDHIKEQIAMIKILEKKGFTYKIGDGVYFDTSKIKDYNKLSHLKLEELKEGARVEKNPEKKNPTDFALWKFSTPHPSHPLALRALPLRQGEKKESKEGEFKGKRQMEWPSPWGVGFPGWHIECSAMATKYLGKQFDIHCGGADHVNIHHTNEIAQSEAATGKKPWVRYWLHNAFLNISGGKKMAKSEENFLTLENALVKNGLNPLVYRYAALGTHYHKPMEYSERAVKNAKDGWEHLINQIKKLGDIKGEINIKYKKRFIEKINDDLNMPDGLAVIQEMLKDRTLIHKDKLATLLDFDKVLGLNLNKFIKPYGEEYSPPDADSSIVISVSASPSPSPAPEEEVDGENMEEVRNLLYKREKEREGKNWIEADRLKKEIENLGYIVEDTKDGPHIYKK